jgi:N utilization substance protein B
MKSRRRAREAALQALYQCDTLDDWNVECIDLYFEIYQDIKELDDVQKANVAFSRALSTGVVKFLDFIDTQIAAASTHWSLARMSRVDRNILRFSTFEIGFMSDIPVSVTINEAIEIAKSYGTDDSPMFINGVLDNIARVFVENPSLVSNVQKKLAVNE